MIKFISLVILIDLKHFLFFSKHYFLIYQFQVVAWLPIK